MTWVGVPQTSHLRPEIRRRASREELSLSFSPFVFLISMSLSLSFSLSLSLYLSVSVYLSVYLSFFLFHFLYFLCSSLSLSSSVLQNASHKSLATPIHRSQVARISPDRCRTGSTLQFRIVQVVTSRQELVSCCKPKHGATDAAMDAVSGSTFSCESASQLMVHTPTSKVLQK